MSLERLFPTIISRAVLPNARSFNRRLLEEIEGMSAEDPVGRQWSAENYRGGYTSYASLSDLHRRTPTFMELEKKLQPHARAFAKAQRWDLKGLDLEMTAMWMNVMPKHTYHTLHLHPHSAISGVYYVNAPRGSVSLKLEDPRMPYYMNAPVRPLYEEIEPVAGMFVLFESWLRHEVPPNQSSEPRVSLSFNYSLTDEGEL